MTSKLNPSTQELRFALDDQVDRQDASDRLSLSGWVIHRKFQIARVLLGSKKQAIACANLEFHRPRVNQLFPEYPDSEMAGFSMNIPAPPAGSYWLRIEGENGQISLVAKIRLVERTQPHLLFMHVPKAAGSTVNKYLTSHYMRGNHEIHIESNPKWHHDIDYIRKLDFVSGHITLPNLAKKLNLANYYKVTLVREPYPQLISHLAWIRKLSDTSEEHRFKRHPKYVQVFSRKLLGTDLSSPRAIRKLVKSLGDSEKRLVDNCQVRYFAHVELRKDVAGENLHEAKETSRIFDRIGTTDAIEEFLQGIAEDMGWAKSSIPISENVSRGYYGLDTTKVKIRAALKPLVRHDVELYRFIRQLRGEQG